MSKVKINFQDNFLNQMKRDKNPVIVYLVNGFKLQGMVKGFDNFTLFLEDAGKLQMVYKHSITTVTPVKNVRFNFQPPVLDSNEGDSESSEE